MRPPVTVRDARADDADAITALARASWRETYRDVFEPRFIDEFIARNYRTEDLRDAASRAALADDSHFLVAERAGTVVGFAHFGIGSRGPELYRIYADPAHFGTGVGAALLIELHSRLAGRVKAYVLDVHERNERGRAFYARNGFVPADDGVTADGHVTLRRVLSDDA